MAVVVARAATLHFPSWPGIVVRRTASLPLAYVPAIHVFLAAEAAYLNIKAARRNAPATAMAANATRARIDLSIPPNADRCNLFRPNTEAALRLGAGRNRPLADSKQATV
jgi:hypothetical protein